MTIEMQELILFGGLATVRTLNTIESGSLKTLENATLLIGKQYIEIIPKTIEDKTSYFWNKEDILGRLYYSKYTFSCENFTDSSMGNVIKKLVFFSVFTWGKLNQDKILASIGVRNPKPSVLSSISSNLESGRKNGLYIKSGQKKQSEFSVSPDYNNSKQLKHIKFSPSQEAIDIVKNRARNYAKSKKS